MEIISTSVATNARKIILITLADLALPSHIVVGLRIKSSSQDGKEINDTEII